MIKIMIVTSVATAFSASLIYVIVGSIYVLVFRPESEISQILKSGGGGVGVVVLASVGWLILSIHTLPFGLAYGVIVILLVPLINRGVRFIWAALLGGMLLCLIWSVNWLNVIMLNPRWDPIDMSRLFFLLPGVVIGSFASYKWCVRLKCTPKSG
jgi:hypothetical protein